MNNTFADVPVVILCGGRGITLGNELRANKGLVKILHKPLFSWVLMHYAQHGAQNFILPTGYQSAQFHHALVETFNAAPDALDSNLYHFTLLDVPRRVRLIETPIEATTGARLLACKPWLEHTDRFALSYSDSLSDVDLTAEMAFHLSQQVTATLLLAKMPVRFRILGIRHGESRVRAFAPRPIIESSPINGGFYIFTNKIWLEKYGLSKGGILENEPLETLSSEGQLTAFSSNSNWQCLDAERDCTALETLAKQCALRAST